LLIAAAVIAAIAVITWLRPAPIAVNVGEVRRGSLRVTVDEEGQTRIRHRYVIGAPAEGRLLRSELEEGDRVNAQQVVARLRPPPLDPRSRAAAEARLEAARSRLRGAEAEVAKARAALSQSQRDLARARRLQEAGTLAPGERERKELEAVSREQDVEAARQAADAAQHELEAARATLLSPGLEPDSHVTSDPACSGEPCLAVRAPASGQVLRIFEESERTVAPGTPLLEIGAPEDLEIITDLLSTDAVKVRPGAPVLVEDWGGGSTLEAHVRLVEPSGFTKLSVLGVEEQRVKMIADFDTPPTGLGDGYRVEVRIVVWDGAAVLKVPTSALFRRGDDSCVFVARRGRAQRQTVSIGQRGATEAEVLSGLAPGDVVILYPSDRVDDGVRVRAL
jgi:HlyD family secretion protein